MQNVKLPPTVNVLRSAQKRLDYVGVYFAEQLTRVAEAVVSLDSHVDVSLSFALDDQGLAVITGNVGVNVTLLCQRCGGTLPHYIRTSYCFSPIVNKKQGSDEWITTLPAAYEPIDVNELGEVDLLAMIEDEIILSLPIVPMHESKHCDVSATEMIFGELPEETNHANPFAVLKNLKKKIKE
ncbi:23S rRNA accumulation protein YceD [Candidatus Regiella endosymbiont of Tuberolachnus salignus]|uniref:23S rRNA accumulation protein YceD n=1 Tax=Candidatus Regiella endosymbiont of Tuberolachnus salignus TaxID=3077956 RepID=UPI0030D24300